MTPPNTPPSPSSTISIIYRGTCEGCIAYKRSLEALPPDPAYSSTAQFAFNALHVAHHARNVKYNRREHFKVLMEGDGGISGHRDSYSLVQIYYDMGLMMLAVGLVPKDVITVPTNVYTANVDKLMGITGGKCLCGCGGALNRGRLFKPGHDQKLIGIFKRIERGELSTMDERVPEAARKIMMVLPHCLCCGNPVMKGVRVGGGWMGTHCADGTCRHIKRQQLSN